MTASRDAADIAEYYNGYSTWYEGERREGYYGVINALEVEALAPYATGKRVLEIGCGTGLILEHTTQMAAHATGIDLSIGMAGVSKEKGLEALNATVNKLPFADDSFDLVYSCKVLPHVPAIADAMSEVDRVLKPGGHAIVEFYNRTSFKALTYRVRSAIRRGEPVWVRHDDIASIDSFMPPNWTRQAVRGIRTLAPAKQLYELPVVGSLMAKGEQAVCDNALGQRFGGYLLVRYQSTAEA